MIYYFCVRRACWFVLSGQTDILSVSPIITETRTQSCSRQLTVGSIAKSAGGMLTHSHSHRHTLVSQILTQKSTSWTGCLGKGVDKIFPGRFLGAAKLHIGVHEYTHTPGPERQVSLCRVAMNPWQHLCCTVRDPYFCHPQGDRGDKNHREQSRERR